MNRQYEQVREFHTAFNQEMPDKPTALGRGGNSRETFLLERYTEIFETGCVNMKNSGIKSEVFNRSSWMMEELVEFMQAKTLEDQVDALTDLIYFAIGTFTLMGVKPEPFFDIVHNANMGKLHADGKPRFNEQGKIIKPEGWAEKYAPEPKIVEELERQSTGY
ncbi:hypothetical protein BCV73_08760 [Paenibacillus sp. SSG-1]|uniref:hypothetical protein n=1 Tax=Paenibacillus sp. SSG-1 TaxID=1443669 RepID=UPI000B7D6970|nr:hypothetical protein [Paenibacillus sp. SSG-1]OXL83158.1 hypothetical protein BCV73_08760 [Paenibacillus sp. SSG-1]